MINQKQPALVSSLAIANYFISRSIQENRPLEHRKLQKLLYIAHGWHLAITGNPLLDEDLVAFSFGVVVVGVFRHLIWYGLDPVDELIEIEEETVFNESQIWVLEKVWLNHGRYSNDDLRDLCKNPNASCLKYYNASPKNVVAIPDEVIAESFRILR